MHAGAALGALLTACATTGEDAVPAATAHLPQASGVFAETSTLPFQTVPFDRIEDSDYAPAFEQAMAIQRAEIAAITANPEAPTFENTVVALERSGRMLERVQIAFSTEVKVSPLSRVIERPAPRLLGAGRDIAR